MKFKFLFLVLIVCSFSVGSFSQEKKFNFTEKENFTIEISSPDNYWQTLNKSPVKVKITNKSEKVLRAKAFERIDFYFSRCSKLSKCNVRGDKFVAYSGVESESLKKDAAVEFEVNLADLYWKDEISSSFDLTEPKNFEIIPLNNNYLYGVVRILERYLEVDGLPKKIPIHRDYESNEIILEAKLAEAK